MPTHRDLPVRKLRHTKYRDTGHGDRLDAAAFDVGFRPPSPPKRKHPVMNRGFSFLCYTIAWILILLVAVPVAVSLFGQIVQWIR